MPSLQEQVRHDASSLFQFVVSITDLCERRNPGAAYLRSSERFFNYIVDLGQETKTYLKDFPGRYKQPGQLLNLRSEIATLRGGWQFLHAFVKPALDCDTLHVPTSLVEGLIDRLREIPGYADTDFVIYHTDECNYFNVRLNIFKPIADGVAALVHGPLFPEKLGLIGIPYSQSSSLFMNCLIPHEMGHHVFSDKTLESKFQQTIEKQLQANCGTMSASDRSRMTNVLVRWVEELFCDLFAVRLVGFCYSFAFIEFLDISKALDEHGKLTRANGMTEFDDYPPHLFRLQQQVGVLNRDKWWDELGGINSHYAKLLQEVEKMKDAEFGLPNIPGVKETFFSVVPTILSDLDVITAGVDSGLESWKKTHLHIENYLAQGIVPSNLLEKPGQLKFLVPSLVSLLNASYKFYVQSLDQLLNNIQQADLNDVSARSEWATKVQIWASKAIEDVTLLKRKDAA